MIIALDVSLYVQGGRGGRVATKICSNPLA